MNEEFQMSNGPRAHRAAGFSLVELMIVLVIFGIVTAVSLPGFNRFMRSLDLNNQVQGAATTMRVARQRAVTENNNVIVYWNASIRGWGYFDDNDNDGALDAGEFWKVPQALPSWITVYNSSTNPFPTTVVRFFPNGTASLSGTCIYRNRDGYQRSLSVVRPTGMVTVN